MQASLQPGLESPQLREHVWYAIRHFSMQAGSQEFWGASTEFIRGFSTPAQYAPATKVPAIDKQTMNNTSRVSGDNGDSVSVMMIKPS